MTFSDVRTQLAYNALALQKQRRMAKAREMAKEAAWRDLPQNEQSRYFEWAYQAVKDTEQERTN